MSPMSQCLFDSARAGAPPSLSSIYSESMKSEPAGVSEGVPEAEEEGAAAAGPEGKKGARRQSV